MPSTCHYRGDKLDDLLDMSKRGHLFGPDICGPARPGEILGHGAYYVLEEATYDGPTDTTTATFTPYVDPRARLRYFGADGTELPPDEIGTPTLHTRDHITKR